MATKFKELLQLTGVPILVASLCCLAPIVLVALGFSTVAFAASLTNVLDGQYRFAFSLAGILLLGISLITYYRKQGICTLNQALKRRHEIINKILLVGIVAFLGYFLFFNVFLTWAGRFLGIWN